MLPIDREVPRKTTRFHNINAVTVMAAQLEVLTKKLESNSKYEHGAPTSTSLRGS